MVYIRINISERVNRILNAIKEEYGLKNKSQAIEFLTEWYKKNGILLKKKISHKNLVKKIKNKRHRRNGHEKEKNIEQIPR